MGENKYKIKVEGKIKTIDIAKIECGNGCEMLLIATMNVDTMRTPDSVDSVITNLQINEIDTACIQETHINRNDHIDRETIQSF